MSDLKETVSSVRWNGLKRLSATRDTTQAELERDVISNARKDGRDIQRVRSARRPTEVFRDGRWVRVMDLR